MSLPYYRVQFMPGSGPFDVPSGTWTTIPKELVRSLRWTTGRDNELDQFRPSTATVVLANNDRLFDPEHTSGIYFGQLLPRVPFRIQLSADDSTWVDQWYGFVRDGWQQLYTKSVRADCIVELEDLLGVLESEPLPRTAYEYEVLQDTPKALWELDETSGSQMADSSGNGLHGRFDNGVQGQDPLIVGDGNSFEVPRATDSRGIYVGESLPQGPPITIAGWVKIPRLNQSEFRKIVTVQKDTSYNSFVALETGPNTNCPNGELEINFFLPGVAGYVARGHMRIDDDVAHHVAVTMSSTAISGIQLFVDGVQQTKTTIAGTAGGNWTGHFWWTLGNAADDPDGGFGIGGLIDGITVFPSALTQSRIAAHYEAGASGFENEFSGTRIGRVLDIIGLPSAMRDIATGDTTVGAAIYGGQSAGSYLQKVVESEQGVLFVNHSDGGKLKFRGRHARCTEMRSMESQATFDSCDYREDVQPEPNGIATVVNVVDVTWRGGTEPVTDDTSRAAYGAQSRSINTEAPTASAAQNAGLWMIARYKEPQVRLRRLPLNLAGKQPLWPTILDLRTSDRITVERHPQGVGAVISNELIIEGSEIALNDDKSWTATYQLSNADDTRVWIWGTGAWGQTTYWG